jgi:hypothetical protein
LAERRLGLFAKGDGHKVEGIIEQLTNGNWASLSGRILHVGEKEYPVLDVQLLLDRFVWLQSEGSDVGEPGSWVDADGAGFKEEETITRA